MPDAPILGGSGKLTLDADVFGAPFNGPLVHEAVIAELAARRRGCLLYTSPSPRDRS